MRHGDRRRPVRPGTRRSIGFGLIAVVLLTALTGCRLGAAPQRSPKSGPPLPPVTPTPPTQQPGGYGVPPLSPPLPPPRPAPYNQPAIDLAGGTEKAQRPPEDYEISRVYPGLVFRFGARDRRQVALTFDDAPDNSFTPQILDVLKQLGVPATFFVVGSRAEQFPEGVARMVEEGHAIGNHSYSHPQLTKMTPERITTELEQTRRVIKRITGVDTHLFRPPYGAEAPAVLQRIFDLGYKVILWDVDSLDWKSLPAGQVIDNDLNHAHNGAIFLHHAAGGHGEDLSGTVQALPTIIRRLQGQGYQFVTIPRLLGIKE